MLSPKLVKHGLLVLAIGLGMSIANAQTVLYVDDDADLGGNCESWATACKYLQDALAGASSDPTVDEIRVAAGVYRPDQDELSIVFPGDREATFELISGVAIYGGYAGLADPDEPRDPISYVTTLSGDLDDDDDCTAGRDPDSDCCHIHETYGGCDPQWCADVVDQYDGDENWCSVGWYSQCVNWAKEHCYCLCPSTVDYTVENSYHVVTASGTDATALLDGFTITAGNADHPPPPQGQPPSVHRYGAGLYAEDGSPTLANCIFAGNSAVDAGGGIYFDNGTPTLTDCQFTDNKAVNRGGGIYSLNSSPTLTDCLFTGNEAADGEPLTGKGGGLYNEGHFIPDPEARLKLTRCTFTDNTALTSGGGLYNEGGNPTLTGCTFADNTALTSVRWNVRHGLGARIN